MSRTARRSAVGSQVARAALALALVLAAVAGAAPPPDEARLPGSPGAAGGTSAQIAAIPVPLPGGEGGIGFDDLLFAPALGSVVVPAGRSGNLDLVDPATRKVVAIPGFSAQGSFVKGHGEGTTSADVGRGLLFAIDRTALKLVVLDSASKTVVGSAALASSPDYVRWIEPTGEVWVTEPDADRIEVFALPIAGAPAPAHSAFVAVPEGPEALVVDAARGRAYTNLWKSTTLAIDLKSREIVARWPNGCVDSRGLALDPARAHLFVGCAEGKAVVLDLNRSGAVLDSLASGEGVDIIAFNAALRHLYLPGGRSATMAILGVSGAGTLSLLATVNTASHAHCVAADDRRQAWVCDPERGRLLLIGDSLPPLQ